MTITYSKADRELIVEKLEHDGLYISNDRIDDILYNVTAAFQQQFDEEASYMIDELVVS